MIGILNYAIYRMSRLISREIDFSNEFFFFFSFFLHSSRALLNEMGSNMSLPTAMSHEQDYSPYVSHTSVQHSQSRENRRLSMLQLTPVGSASGPLVEMDDPKGNYKKTVKCTRKFIVNVLKNSLYFVVVVEEVQLDVYESKCKCSIGMHKHSFLKFQTHDGFY